MYEKFLPLIVAFDDDFRAHIPRDMMLKMTSSQFSSSPRSAGVTGLAIVTAGLMLVSSANVTVTRRFCIEFVFFNIDFTTPPVVGGAGVDGAIVNRRIRIEFALSNVGFMAALAAVVDAGDGGADVGGTAELVSPFKAILGKSSGWMSLGTASDTSFCCTSAGLFNIDFSGAVDFFDDAAGDKLANEAELIDERLGRRMEALSV